MDAIEFVKQLRRMEEKGLKKNRFIYLCAGREADSPEEVVAEVEEWAKKNPVKTRQSVFLEQYPEASISKDGVLTIESCKVEKSIKCNGMNCARCRREFWMQEVE